MPRSTPKCEMGAPYQVFISYSHGAPTHMEGVLRLSNNLRAFGIETVLDQYLHTPPEGWPRWMEKAIRTADFVLVVCSASYLESATGSATDRGRGVKWEEHLIYQHMYNSGTLNTRFIPVLLDGERENSIPTPLQSATHYRVSSASLADPGFIKLYHRLVDQGGSGESLNKAIENVPVNAQFAVRDARFFFDIDTWVLDEEGHRQVVSASKVAGLRQSVVDLLREHKATSPDPTERYWAYHSLGRIGGAEALALLRSAQRDEDTFARLGARQALELASEKSS